MLGLITVLLIAVLIALFVNPASAIIFVVGTIVYGLTFI